MIHDQAKPRKLGRYELEECLGTEDGIDTYRARVRGLAGFDRIFAVKCLHRGRGTPINLNDPFIRVAKRVANITDNRLARILDADVIDGIAIAVTEFVHGLDLDRFRECAQVAGVLATGSDESAEKWQKIVAYIGAEVAGGLAAIHALSPPLVHGSLCPRNIITTARGGIKVLDMGLRQAALTEGESISPRARAYAGPEPAGTPPGPTSDMRALGAMLFELATGELPPPGVTSAATRTILEALWPAMADFIAGLLAEDPALRPSAEESARILGAYWSDVTDAAMVAEMTALVRNFSAFVADATLPSTPTPLPTEPRQADAELPVPAAVSSLAPPPPPLPPPSPFPPFALSSSGSFLAVSDEPTRVMPGENYASDIFQSFPADVASPADAANSAEEPTASWSDARVDEAKSADGNLEMMPSLAIDLPDIETTNDSPPIPELADWGAQALAALGNQAGVEMPSLPTAPEMASAEPAVQETAPPPVNDPDIEDAFAFVPPTQPAAPPLPPMASPPPPVENKPKRTTSAASVSEILGKKDVLIWPLSPTSLEADLVHDPQDPGAIMANAFEAPATDFEEPSGHLPDASGGEHSEGQPGANSALETTAFVLEEEAPDADEWAPARLAYEMPASEDAQVRPSASHEAMGAKPDPAKDADGNSVDVRPSRTRRVIITAVVTAGICGILAGGVVKMGVFGKRIASPALPTHPSAQTRSVLPPPPAPKPVAAKAPQSPPATEKPIAQPAPVAPATPTPTVAGEKPVPVAPATPTPTVAGGKPASAVSMIGLPIATEPSGAMVWIDGEEQGKTPCAVKLKPGSARLVLVHAGYLTSQSSMEVREGAKIDVTLKAVEPPLQGEARFRAECKTEGKLPLVVDGKETGILCPYSKMRFEPGVHTVGVLVPSTGKVYEKELTFSAGVRSLSFNH
jgi:serine/threonine protein kinase